MGGAAGAPHPLPIYFMSKMHTKTIQKIQKAYIKTYEKGVKIYKDIENSQGTLLLQKCRPLYFADFVDIKNDRVMDWWRLRHTLRINYQSYIKKNTKC